MGDSLLKILNMSIKLKGLAFLQFHKNNLRKVFPLTILFGAFT